MARPRADGTPAREVNRRKLTDLFVSTRKAGESGRTDLGRQATRPRVVGADDRQEGVEGDLSAPWPAALAASRRRQIHWPRRCAAAGGEDRARRFRWQRPGCERKAERLTGTFADLASQYVELHAKKHNKSWKQAERLVQRHLLPRWGKLKATAITRAEVRAAMIRIDAPIVANQTLAAASAIFAWAVGQEIATANPCVGVDRNPTTDRERVLSDAEIEVLYGNFDPALKLILLTGQRPGEVAAMQPEHIVDGWWQMPGKPQGDWPGTKNGKDHRVALSEPAQVLIRLHLADKGGVNRSSSLMKKLVAEFGIERATPHDLRRTCLTTITRLGFGRDAMDRIANHRTRAVTDVYDRHSYADEDRRIMTTVARHIASLVEESVPTNVVALR